MKANIKNQIKMALMVGPMNELEARLDDTLNELFPLNPDCTEDKIKKVREQLFHWQYSNGERSNFSSLVFNLMSKADPANTSKLMRGFPVECHVWSEWHESKDPDALFKSWGFM